MPFGYTTDTLEPSQLLFRLICLLRHNGVLYGVLVDVKQKETEDR